MQSSGPGARSHWGWGYEAQQPSHAERCAAAAGLAEHLGFGSEPEEPVALNAVQLPAPRVRVPAALAHVCSQDHGDRVRHAAGRSYLDVVRGMRGRFPHPPDAVARPAGEADLALVLEWCSDERLAVIPYGGGTSVVGGVDAIPAPAMPARSASTSDASTAFWRSTGSRAPRASRPARTGRAWSASSGT